MQCDVMGTPDKNPRHETVPGRIHSDGRWRSKAPASCLHPGASPVLANPAPAAIAVSAVSVGPGQHADGIQTNGPASKQLRLTVVPTLDQEFARGLVLLGSRDQVLQLKGDDREAVEHATDLGMVVDREQRLALHRAHGLGEPFVLAEWEVDAIAYGVQYGGSR